MMMEAKYTEADMVSFGKYLLSKTREKLLRNNHKATMPYIERKRIVNHADIENWKEFKRQSQNN